MVQHHISRNVIHIGGYDPMPPEAFFARFNRELARSAACWNLTASTRDFTVAEDRATWMTVLEGVGWRAETAFELLRWDDVIRGHRHGSTPQRWWGGMSAFFDFVLHGALWRYLRTAWRYAIFFLYPFAALLAAMVLAGMLASHLVQLLPVPSSAGWLAGLVAAGALAYALVARSHIGHLLDDWAYASAALRQPDATISARLERAAERTAFSPADAHMLVTGHSLGAVLAAELVSRTVSQPTAAATEVGKIGFLALGSSILKLALHERATILRQQLATLNASGRVTWIEYQSLSDVMNFYKSDPVKALKLPGPSPIVRQARFSRMLNPAFYARIKRNFFRLHCQFISGNDLRAPFDYIITTCGPFDPEALARAPLGAMEWLDDKGAITAAGVDALLAGWIPSTERKGRLA